MKRPVSLAASLAMVCATGACGPGAATKADFNQVCLERMGGSQTRCACYVDSIEKDLKPDLFAKLAQGVVDNRRFAGMIPEEVRADPAISSAIDTAAKACLR